MNAPLPTENDILAATIEDISCRDWNRNCLCECCKDRRIVQLALDARDKKIERLRADIETLRLGFFQLTNFAAQQRTSVEQRLAPDVGDDVPRCNTHGTSWKEGCRGCSEAERLTETPPDSRISKS